MKRFAKFIALLAIAVFLPSTVLSAAPLVWCVSGDDHRAIEFGISGHWHGDGRHLHISVSGDEARLPTGPDGHSHGCLDNALLGPMASSGAKVPVFVPPASKSPVWAVTAVQRSADVSRIARAIRPPPRRTSNDARLALLSTTRLLL